MSELDHGASNPFPGYQPPRLRVTASYPNDNPARSVETVEIEVNDGPIDASFVESIVRAVVAATTTERAVDTQMQIAGPTWGSTTYPYSNTTGADATVTFSTIDGREGQR